jgi:hypothetical protein
VSDVFGEFTLSIAYVPAIAQIYSCLDLKAAGMSSSP